MGCNEVKDTDLPTLICFFEPNNEQQKMYCLKLKDNFHHEQSIRYEIKSTADNKFAIKFKIKKNIYDIQTVFNDSEEEMNKALEAMYRKLDELNPNSNPSPNPNPEPR